MVMRVVDGEDLRFVDDLLLAEVGNLEELLLRELLFGLGLEWGLSLSDPAYIHPCNLLSGSNHLIVPTV